jgi:hypothetical protein
VTGNQQHEPVRPTTEAGALPPEFTYALSLAQRNAVLTLRLFAGFTAVECIFGVYLAATSKFGGLANLVLLVLVLLTACPASLWYFLRTRRLLVNWYTRAASLSHFVQPVRMVVWVPGITEHKSMLDIGESYAIDLAEPGQRIGARRVILSIAGVVLATIAEQEVDVYIDPDPNGPVVLHTPRGWLVEYASPFALSQRFPNGA